MTEPPHTPQSDTTLESQPHSPPNEKSTTVVDWDGPHDPANPINWPSHRKWITACTACFVTFLVGINATGIASAADEINADFGISDETFPNSYWPVTSWNVAAAISPLVILPLMENFGVRYSYIAIYFVFCISVIPQGLAHNFATLIGVRVLSGVCAGVLQNVTGGIICDMWDDKRARSVPLSLFALGLLGGTTFGPVFGGAVISHLDWRWIFYIQCITYAALLPFLFLAVPEMRGAIILKHRAAHIRKTTGREAYSQTELEDTKLLSLLHEALMRPLWMLFTEPLLLFSTLWSAFCIGNIFLMSQAIPIVYEDSYGWSLSSSGLVQASVLIGLIIGCIAQSYGNKLYTGSERKPIEGKGALVPEARLYLSVFGSLFGFALGLAWYSASSNSSVHWIVPSIGLALVGFGIFTLVFAASSYVTDAYGKYASSACAGLAFGENMFAALLPLAAQKMYESLGTRWASGTLAFIALGLSGIPILFIIYGKNIRAKSPFISEASDTSEKAEVDPI